VTIEQPSTEDIELLKQRIHDSLNNQYRNKQLYDELEHLKSMISRFEKSIMFAKKQLEVLKYLKEHDEEEIKRQEQEIERYVVEIEEYRKKLG
jgi:DNA repair exonuclease SbcCD ATPase subunit